MEAIRKIMAMAGLDFAERARREIRHEEETAARKGAVRYSRGSVRIQHNAFQTRGDLNRRLVRAGLPPVPPENHD